MINELYSAITDICRATPYSCSRLNCFAVVDSERQIDEANIGKILDGDVANFWSRGGATKKDYAALLIKNVGYNIESGCYEFMLSVLDIVKCAGCNDDCIRSVDKIDIDNLDLLRYVVLELKSLRKVVLTNGTDTISKLLSEKHIFYLKGIGYTEVSALGCEARSPTVSTLSNVWFENFGIDNLRSVGVRIRVCDCDEIRTQPNYGIAKNVEEVNKICC